MKHIFRFSVRKDFLKGKWAASGECITHIWDSAPKSPLRMPALCPPARGHLLQSCCHTALCPSPRQCSPPLTTSHYKQLPPTSLVHDCGLTWDGDGQGSLASCSPWGRKESDMTATELNWNNSGNLHQMVLSRYFWEELKQRLRGKTYPGKEGLSGSCSVTQLLYSDLFQVLVALLCLLHFVLLFLYI